MNTLYNHALKQVHQIKDDLERYQVILDSEVNGVQTNGLANSSSLKGTTAGIVGGLVASLSSLGRTIEDYKGLAKRELVKEKQEKAVA